VEPFSSDSIISKSSPTKDFTPRSTNRHARRRLPHAPMALVIPSDMRRASCWNLAHESGSAFQSYIVSVLMVSKQRMSGIGRHFLHQASHLSGAIAVEVHHPRCGIVSMRFQAVVDEESKLVAVVVRHELGSHTNLRIMSSHIEGPPGKHPTGRKENVAVQRAPRRRVRGRLSVPLLPARNLSIVSQSDSKDS
jgi:hypothetical protein